MLLTKVGTLTLVSIHFFSLALHVWCERVTGEVRLRCDRGKHLVIPRWMPCLPELEDPGCSMSCWLWESVMTSFSASTSPLLHATSYNCIDVPPSVMLTGQQCATCPWPPTSLASPRTPHCREGVLSGIDAQWCNHRAADVCTPGTRYQQR